MVNFAVNAKNRKSQDLQITGMEKMHQYLTKMNLFLNYGHSLCILDHTTGSTSHWTSDIIFMFL